MQPGQRIEKAVLLRAEAHSARLVHIGVILVQRQAEEGEKIVDARDIVVEGEFQRDLISQPVAVGIAVPEAVQHLGQLLHRLGRLQAQLV